jgi:hypothetical protein
MNRPLLLALVLLALPASAQVRGSAGALVGYQRIESGSGVTAGVNAAGQWRRLLVQAHAADVAASTYEEQVPLADGTFFNLRNEYVTFGLGLDAHYVQPVAGPVSATLGTGLVLTRLDEVVTVDGVPGQRWFHGYRLYVGGLVGDAGRVRLQARLALAPSSDPIERGRVQVGVLVPIR